MKITKSLKGSRKLSDFDQIFLFFVMYEHEVRLYGFRKFYCHSLWYTSLGAPQQQRLTHAVFIFLLFYLAKIVFRQHAQFFSFLRSETHLYSLFIALLSYTLVVPIVYS